MSQPPSAGTGEAPAGTDVPSSDFGATTVSGTPTAKRTRQAKQEPNSKPSADHANSDHPVANAGNATTTRPPLVTGTATGWTPPVGAPTGAPSMPQQPLVPQVAPHGGPGPVGPAGAPVAAKTTGRPAQARGPRRAQLQLRHINPVTVLKFSCVLGVALFFVWLIVVGVLYGVLDASGVIGKVNDTVTTINGSGSNRPVTAGVVFGGAAIVGVINVVLFIALSTVGSMVYNLCADLVGGIELTLSER